MQCPLCGGPLHVEDEARFVCERDHEVPADDLRAAATPRVTVALWMAIEALESEAESLRMLHSFGRGDGAGDLAAQAEKDARILRELASTHVPPGSRPTADGD
jgi:hypothetical protein